MTNKERLACLPNKLFIRECRQLFINGLSNYIDYEAYLDSDNEDIKYFLRALGFCDVVPSEAAIMAAETEAMRTNEFFNKNLFIQNNTKTVMVLGEKTLFGSEYYETADLNEMKIISIPKANTRSFRKIQQKFRII